MPKHCGACRKYDDSKALAAAKRNSLFDQMKADPQLVWSVDAISAQHISSHMLAPSRTSLNEIALQSTLGLLRNLQDSGMNVVAVRCIAGRDAADHQANSELRVRAQVCMCALCELASECNGVEMLSSSFYGRLQNQVARAGVCRHCRGRRQVCVALVARAAWCQVHSMPQSRLDLSDRQRSEYRRKGDT